MSNCPNAAEDQGHVDAVESEKAPRIILLHDLDNLLDVLVAHFPRGHVTEVKNCRPLFDFAGQHCLIDDVV